MPEHRVISTFGEQPPLVGQTLAAIFLLFFIFQIREYWSQAIACLPSFALVARLPFLLCKKQQNSQLCDKSLPKIKFWQNQLSSGVGNGLVEAKTVRWTVFSESRSSYAAHAPVQALPKLVQHFHLYLYSKLCRGSLIFSFTVLYYLIIFAFTRNLSYNT